MKSISIFFFVSLLVVGFKCQDVNKIKNNDASIGNVEELCFLQSEIDKAFGFEGSTDAVDTFVVVMNLINRSKFDEALNLLQQYSLDTLWHSGFFGLRPRNSLDTKLHYLVYRYEEALQNLPFEALDGLLVMGAHDSSVNFRMLNEIELLYISNMYRTAELDAQGIVKACNKLIKKIGKKSFRLEFIKASALMTLKRYDEAIEIYKSLVTADYYPFQSLKSIAEAYVLKGDTSNAKSYRAVFHKMFPTQSLLIDININSSEGEIIDVIKSFVLHNRQRERILAKTILARHLLLAGETDKLDSVITSYLKGFKELTTNDPVLKYEAGVYFDLKMRLLFKLKKYDQICEFALLELRDNPVVQINSE
ncbi:MAG TPA: hypothetical protein VFM18_02230, partial [Methanosarcina sp.]|nr:hypothetical protein [Methanosarcina sp.]